MNLEQAKAKLADIISTKNRQSSYATATIQVHICELCVIMKFLLDEIERIKTPSLTVLKRLPEDVTGRTPSPYEPARLPSPPPGRSRPVNPPHPNRKGNAGDAE